MACWTRGICAPTPPVCKPSSTCLVAAHLVPDQGEQGDGVLVQHGLLPAEYLGKVAEAHIQPLRNVALGNATGLQELGGLFEGVLGKKAVISGICVHVGISLSLLECSSPGGQMQRPPAAPGFGSRHAASRGWCPWIGGAGR
jgi:hypothetical protein